MTFSTTTFLIDLLLLVIQVLAALPWVLLTFSNREKMASTLRNLGSVMNRGSVYGRLLLMYLVGGVVGLLVVTLVFVLTLTGSSSLEGSGYFYGAILQIQLLIDGFILVFAVLLWVWPKGGAIALSAFREGIRQPMFWLLFGAAYVAMSISPLIPYFTFGEDHLVVQDIGYDTIMMVAVIFGALAASMSISEEIEGRTAVTLMSKPVSRRQFLIGKFVGHRPGRRRAVRPAGHVLRGREPL